MAEHEEYCASNNTARIIMPQVGKDGKPPTLKFEKHVQKYRVPVVAYADFECILEKPDEDNEQWIGEATKVIQYHRAMSYCLYFVRDPYLEDSWLTITNLIPHEPIVYRGPDAAKHFMKTLTMYAKDLDEAIDCRNIKLLPLTKREKERHNAADFCEACNERFNKDKVYDHCHITGIYRNALCRKCNLQRERQSFIPVFLHNSSNYDTHLIIPELGRDKDRLSVIPNSSEKYISFTKQISPKMHLRFIDTFRFTPDSLDNLVTNLVKSASNPEDLSKVLPHTAKVFGNKLSLVSRKGVFPYDYCDSWQRLEETLLPPKEAFFSKLVDRSVSSDDYEHAQTVWNQFSCRTLGEYSDLYLKTDVLLLADVFESFRDVCMKTYDLDCAHYFTSPGFSFDVMLKYTKVELELLTDYDMYMFIERGIRGGITNCIHRHAVANNAYTGAPIDPEKPTSYLLYTDANNLYGWIGYILEVDIEYPSELHDEHNDFPFLAENKKTLKSNHVRLMTALSNRERYVCHYRTLKQAVQHGLKITKVHRGVRFEQEDFLAPYIMLNTRLRQQSKNKFEKNFFKLMNNAVFGKTMENVRKRVSMELVNDEKRLKKLIARPVYKDRIIFGENICAVTMHKEKVELNKPIYIGLTVLDISKTLMYEFHYNIMKPIYKDRLQLLYQDTDSLFYLVKTEDMYNDIINNQQLRDTFDTSEYPADHPCYSDANKMVLGKFKDEYAGRAPLEYVGLRSKLYACRCYNSDPNQLTSGLIKKAKGVRRPILGRELSKMHPDAERYIGFQDYLDCLYGDEDIYREQVMFGTRKHQIMTQVMRKKALSKADEKS
ncbi:uncharacterized protein LOC120352187 [Nilaparvata lugens]|uniref:uncharacterized protein LOC120352187 n=1 Tax=Nilaparvata lugens TaxID=108931 RepID=UPI00193DFBE6|nr:uncharacterized protein LOC120352187 [Nilaparvata lugens]